jgi:hypothetical protein
VALNQLRKPREQKFFVSFFQKRNTFLLRNGSVSTLQEIEAAAIES